MESRPAVMVLAESVGVAPFGSDEGRNAEAPGSNSRYLNLAGTGLPVKVHRNMLEVISSQRLTGN